MLTFNYQFKSKGRSSVYSRVEYQLNIAVRAATLDARRRGHPPLFRVHSELAVPPPLRLPVRGHCTASDNLKVTPVPVPVLLHLNAPEFKQQKRLL